mgnify:CR=1 FL=1
MSVSENSELMADAERWSALSRPTPQWFEDAPLGIFVHWGPYSVPAWAEDHGELGVEEDWEAWFTHNSYAEWYFNTIRIPGSPAAQRHKDLYGSASYDAFLDAWDPDAWDPAEWMRLFHRAGAGYAVLTTKHHDGVTLWDAPETGTRNTVRRGPRTDLVAGFADAARDEGLRVGLYYSGGLDWHYRPHRPILSEDDCKDLCRPKDADYARYCFVHVRDLINRYQPDVIWNDIEWPDEGKNFGPHGLGTLFEYFYAARPEGVTNDRYGGVHADYLTSEYQHMGDEREALGELPRRRPVVWLQPRRGRAPVPQRRGRRPPSGGRGLARRSSPAQRGSEGRWHDPARAARVPRGPGRLERPVRFGAARRACGVGQGLRRHHRSVLAGRGLGASSRSRGPRRRGGGCIRYARVGSAERIRLLAFRDPHAGRGVLVGWAESDPAGGGAASERCSRRCSAAGHHRPTGVRRGCRRGPSGSRRQLFYASSGTVTPPARTRARRPSSLSRVKLGRSAAVTEGWKRTSRFHPSCVAREVEEPRDAAH